MSGDAVAYRKKQESETFQTLPKPRIADDPMESKKEDQSGNSDTKPKESYEDYIKSLPPPFWETKRPPPSSGTDVPPPRNRLNPSAQEIAASINAVCAPVTAADRKEDERRKSRSLHERWKDWRSHAKERESDPDLRPMESGSKARLNVWGSNLTDKRRKN